MFKGRQIFRQKPISALIVLAFLFGTIIYGYFFSSHPTYAASRQSTLNLSISTNTLSLDILPTPDGAFNSSDNATISVKTNNFTGYTLSILGDEDGFLVSDEGYPMYSIPSAVSETNFRTSSTYNNKWGYKPSQYITSNNGVNTTVINTDNYLPSPDETTGDIIDITNAANTQNNTYTLAIGARANTELVPGTYENTFTIVAISNAIVYNVYYNANTTDTVNNMPLPNPQGSEIPGGTATASSYVTLSSAVPERTGFTFGGWCDKATTNDATTGNQTCSGNTFAAGSNYGINQTIDNTDIELYAIWHTNQYNITITPSTGISSIVVKQNNTTICTITNSNTCSLYHGVAYDITATPATGYNFNNWSDSKDSSAIGNANLATTTYTPSDPTSVLTASATAKTYTITLNKNGATNTPTASVTATYNNTTLSNISTLPTRSYTISGFTIPSGNNANGATVSSSSTLTSTYTFNGWYKESGATNKIAGNTATPALQASTTYTDANSKWINDGAVTLYAGWTAQAKTLPTITKEGYTCGWTTTSTGATTITYASGGSITPSGNTTLYGVCVIKNNLSLKVSFNSTYVSSIAVKTGSASGTTVGTVSTSGNSVTGLTYGTAYYLVPTYTTGSVLNSWAKDSGAVGTLSSTSAANPTYTIGDGTNAVTHNGKRATYTVTLDKCSATNTPSASATATYYSTTLSTITLPTRSYTISFTNNVSGATASSTSTLTSTYTFNGWYTGSCASPGTLVASTAATPALQSSVSGYTDSSKRWTRTSAATLYANWTSQAKTLPTITKAGHTCSWYDSINDNTYASGASVTPSSNLSLTSVCTAVDYTVTLRAGNGISALTLAGWTGSGTGTLTKTYHIGDTIDLSTVTPTYKTGYNGAKYIKNDSIGSISGSTYTVGAGNGDITISASSLNAPVCTMQGGATKVFNQSATTLTATSNASSYDTNVNITYSFGFANSATNTLGNFSTAQAGNTFTLNAGSFRGTKYYGVTVVVTDPNDNTITNTCTSGTGSNTGTTVANRTTMSLVNSRIDFSAGTGGTLSGTSPVYVAYNGTNSYSTRTGTTARAIPTATKTGYTFNGWYTAATGGSQVVDASGNRKASVSSWTNASSQWVRTTTNDNATNNTLYAQYTAKTYTVTLDRNCSTTATGSTSTTATYDATTLAAITVPTCSNSTSTRTVSGFTKATSATNSTISSTSTLNSTSTTTYTFNGWHATSGTGTLVASTAATPALQASTDYTDANKKWTYDDNATLYAGWTASAGAYNSVTLPTITRTGSTCGWSTSSTATTIQYASGASITPTANTTLYGVCVTNISLNANGGTGGSTSTTVNYNATTLGTITNPTRANTTGTRTVSGFTKTTSATNSTVSSTTTLNSTNTTTYTFNGWYKESGATNKIASNATTPALQASTTYTDANSKWTYTTAGAITLYAGWTASAGAYSAVTLPTITRTGSTCGWSTSSTGTTISYNSGASFTPTANTTLYGVCVNDISINKNNCPTTAGGATSATVNYNSTSLNSFTAPTCSNGTASRTVSGFTKTTSATNSTISSTSTLTSSATTTYTYAGLYKESGLTNLIANTSRALQASTTYTNSSKRWTYTTAGAITLYAKFNSSTGSYSAVTLPTITRTGSTCGWSTSSTATTITYNSGASLTPTANTTLYGVCVNNITLNNSGATTAGSTSATVNYNATALSTITVPQRQYTVSGFTKTASATDATVSSTSTKTNTATFNGWYTASSGGTKIAAGGTDTTPDLQASTTYTDANKKWTYTTAGAITLYSQWTDNSVTLPTITRTGSTCGWATSSTATTIAYASGAGIVPTSNLVLYGVCRTTYNLSFNANGGSGAPASQTITNNSTSATFTISSTTPTRSGYTFAGWIDERANEAQASSSFTTSETDTVFYAKWTNNSCKPNATTIGTGNTSTDAKCLQDVKPSMKASLPIATATTGTYTLIDARDGQSYTIAKLADGELWLTKNLNYGSSSDTLLTSYDTDLPSGTTFKAPAITTDFATANSSSTYILPKILTDSTYGGYYSFAAAIASTTAYSPSQEIATSICPKGWDLPTRTMYNNLRTTSGNTTYDAMNAAPYSFIYAGYRNGTSFTDQTSATRLWTSTNYGSSYAYYTSAYSTAAYSGNYKRFGESVRCIASSGTATINYNANGGSGTMANQTNADLNIAVVSSNTFTAPAGRQFKNWNTSANGTGTTVNVGDPISSIATIGSTVTLYAQWDEVYYIAFNANGGSGTMTNQTIIRDTHTPIKTNTFTRSGFIFYGWNTAANGSGTFYSDGKTVTNLSATGNTITLYAVWVEGGYLDIGQTVNQKLKRLAGNSTARYNTTDTAITAIVRSNTLPNDFTPATENTISASSSPAPIYAWYDSTNATIYYYSTAANILMNGSSGSFFYGMRALSNLSSISTWDTTKVTNMAGMFEYTGYNGTTFALDLSSWRTSSVTNMSSMFEDAGYSATTWSVIGLSSWDTSSVTSMNRMFQSAGNSVATFTLDLSSWDTSSVTGMTNMFSRAGLNATTFTLNLSSWDTSSVTSMSNLFEHAGENALSWSVSGLPSWNTSSVTSMSGMFLYAGYSATTWSIGDISSWNTSNVTSMQQMFKYAGYSISSFSLNLSSWNTSSLTNIGQMFDHAGYSATTWSIGNLSSWDTSKVTYMSEVFQYAAYNATTWSIGNLSSWDTSKVTTMVYMFYGTGYNSNSFILNLSNWNTSSVTNMSNMFLNAGARSTTWSITIPRTNNGTSTGPIANTTSRFYGSSTSVYADSPTHVSRYFTLAN